MKLALVDHLRALPAAQRRAVIDSLTTEELAALEYAWRSFWARPDDRDPADPRKGWGQIRPAGGHRWWALMGGRGGGKTQAAAQDVIEAARLGKGVIVHVVGQTIEDAVATAINGVSGLDASSPPWMGFKFHPSKDKEGPTFTWANGARGRVFGAEVARKGRGPQCNVMWLDDVAAFGSHGRAVIEQLDLGFRLPLPDGSEPRGVISSTWGDSDAMAWLREQRSLVYSFCETDDNRANLAASFFTQMLDGIAGTEQEQIERRGKDPNVIKRRVFAPVDFARCRAGVLPERFKSVAVWIDPSLATTEKACEVGIICGGMTHDGRAVLLEDASAVLSALEWPTRAHEVLERWAPMADEPAHFGVETNAAQAQPEALLRTTEMVRRLERGESKASIIRIETVHTKVGKAGRAQEIVRLYLSGQVLHVAGLEILEGQLRELDETTKGGPGRDRADAAVYLVLDFFGILHKVRPGYVGGSTVVPAAYGGPGLGSVNVGSMGASAPAAPPAAPGGAVFSFGGAGRFGGGTFT